MRVGLAKKEVARDTRFFSVSEEVRRQIDNLDPFLAQQRQKFCVDFVGPLRRQPQHAACKLVRVDDGLRRHWHKNQRRSGTFYLLIKINDHRQWIRPVGAGRPRNFRRRLSPKFTSRKVPQLGDEKQPFAFAAHDRRLAGSLDLRRSYFPQSLRCAGICGSFIGACPETQAGNCAGEKDDFRQGSYFGHCAH